MSVNLAAFASHAAKSRGRREPESADPHRSAFARDRDRIIHSAAFRRLQYKTQVFVYHEGDHYRTRLTHSLEVSQIARSIARSLHLDEDLTEALALAHDLGHTPFGHAGERALNTLMQPFGGFDHNAQALRIVTKLESRYARYDGLNLTWETLEGLVKHNGPLMDASGHAMGPYAGRGLPAAIIEYSEVDDLELASYASAEAQVAALSDDIAYNAHDIDDGLRAGLFDVIELGDIPLVGKALAEVLKAYPKLERGRIIHETVRRVISGMVSDVLAQSSKNIARLAPKNVDEVRALKEPLVSFSRQMVENNRVLKSFLTTRMYRHERVMEIMARAQRVMGDLFEAYMDDEKLLSGEVGAAKGPLPPLLRSGPPSPEEKGRMRLPFPTPLERGDHRVAMLGEVPSQQHDSLHARQVCDFVAGMTDRYALTLHKRLFDLDPLFR